MSDWRIIDNPLLAPHACILCGREAGGTGPVIDTARDVLLAPHGGRVYACGKCIELAAVLFEFLDAEGTEERLDWRKRIGDLERQLAERDERNDQLALEVSEGERKLAQEISRCETAEARCAQLQAALDRVRGDAEAQLSAVAAPGAREHEPPEEGEE